MPVLSVSPIKSNSKRNILPSAFSIPSTQSNLTDQLLSNRPTATSIFQRISQDARPLTPNEIGQYQFLIRNIGANNINITSNANNWQATIRVRNGGLNTSMAGSSTDTTSSPNTASNSMHVTQQMRNLSLRHNRLSMRSIALRDFRNSLNIPVDQRGDSEMPPLNQEAQNYSRFLTRMYRCAIFRSNNPAESTFVRNSAAVPAVAGTPSPFMRSVTSANAAATNRNARASAMSQAQLVPNIPLVTSLPAAGGSTTPTATVMSAFGSSPLARPTLPPPVNRDLARSLIHSLTVLFLGSRAPATTTSPITFTGVITADLASKIAQWLITEYHDHAMIRLYFNGTTANATQKVRNFLHHCGIKMQTVNGVIKVKREQSLELLMVMTYMLQVSGYNNAYFYN